MRNILTPGRTCLTAILIAFAQFSTLPHPVEAAQPISCDRFNPGPNGSVSALAVQSDGKVLVGGSFTNLGGQPRSYIGRVHPNGTLDGDFHPLLGKTVSDPPLVSALAMQPDGKILVGGNFVTLGQQPHTNLVRLNSDGTLDAQFNPSFGASGRVRCLAIQADGKILVGGYFTNLCGQFHISIGRLNANGTVDGVFNPQLDTGDTVFSLAVQPDNKILVGGRFLLLALGNHRNIVRLNADGTLGTANAAPNDAVLAIAVQADGKIVLGGGFTTVGGVTRNRIARLQNNTSLDSSFNPNADASVTALAVQTDGKILVGGDFVHLGGQTRYGIARLNVDGTLDSGFDAIQGGNISSLAIQPDGKILVGGTLGFFCDQLETNMARLNNSEPATQSLTFDGSTATWLRSGTSPEIWRSTFDYSNEGLFWIPLGTGSRITGGWQLTGLSLSSNVCLRARGYVTGNQNASDWFQEAYYGSLGFTSHPVSRINDAGTLASFGVVAGGSGPIRY